MITREEIREILGPVDEELIAAILGTGATTSELAEAQAWTTGDEAMVNEGRRLPTGRVGELVSLLEPNDTDEGQ